MRSQFREIQKGGAIRAQGGGFQLFSVRILNRMAIKMSFVEVKSVKKSFGQGDSRVEVLKGIDLEIFSCFTSCS